MHRKRRPELCAAIAHAAASLAPPPLQHFSLCPLEMCRHRCFHPTSATSRTRAALPAQWSACTVAPAVPRLACVARPRRAALQQSTWASAACIPTRIWTPPSRVTGSGTATAGQSRRRPHGGLSAPPAGAMACAAVCCEVAVRAVGVPLKRHPEMSSSFSTAVSARFLSRVPEYSMLVRCPSNFLGCRFTIVLRLLALPGRLWAVPPIQWFRLPDMGAGAPRVLCLDTFRGARVGPDDRPWPASPVLVVRVRALDCVRLAARLHLASRRRH